MKKNNTALGLIFGAGIGLSIGVITGNLATCLFIGSAAGLVLGTSFGTFGSGKKP